MPELMLVPVFKKNKHFDMNFISWISSYYFVLIRNFSENFKIEKKVHSFDNRFFQNANKGLKAG